MPYFSSSEDLEGDLEGKKVLLKRVTDIFKERKTSREAGHGEMCL